MLTDLSLPPFYVFIGSSYGKKKSEANEAKTILRLSEQLMGGDGGGLGPNSTKLNKTLVLFSNLNFVDDERRWIPPNRDYRQKLILNVYIFRPF